MADHAKKTKASMTELSNEQLEQESKGPKKIGSPLATKGDDAKRKSDKKSSDKKYASRIEAFDLFQELKESWPEDMSRLFDLSLAEDKRVELWQIMSDGGESMRRRFGWAIPDERALRILEHFGPIVQIGSGLGYWAMLLRSRGVDVHAYDEVGGKPLDEVAVGAEVSRGEQDRDGTKEKEKDAPGKQNPNGQDAGEADGEDEEPLVFWTEVKEGGPERLEEECNEGRSLFLCYPDEFQGDEAEDDDDDDDDDGDDGDESDDEGLGHDCLHSFGGDVVIHVGELFGDSVCMTPGQSPWGRTTSRECQEELVSRFHCILKVVCQVPLPRWPHSRDALTVWILNESAAVYYGSDEDEEAGGDNDEEEEEGEKEGGGTEDMDTEETKEPPKGNRPSKEKKLKKDKGGEDGDGVAKVGSKTKGKDEKDKDKSEDMDKETKASSKGVGAGAARPNCDIFAFIPDDEQLSCVQAAPCVQFLLEDVEASESE